MFLDFSDSLANQPIDDLLRFAILFLSISALRAEERLKKPSKELKQEIDKLREAAPGDQVSSKPLQAALTRLAVQQQLEQRRLEAETERLRRQRDRNMQKIEHRLESQIREVQTWFKFWAVVLPICRHWPPGLVIFFRRRSRERKAHRHRRQAVPVRPAARLAALYDWLVQGSVGHCGVARGRCEQMRQEK
jgi:hypothetical protein